MRLYNWVQQIIVISVNYHLHWPIMSYITDYQLYQPIISYINRLSVRPISANFCFRIFLLFLSLWYTELLLFNLSDDANFTNTANLGDRRNPFVVDTWDFFDAGIPITLTVTRDGCVPVTEVIQAQFGSSKNWLMIECQRLIQCGEKLFT